MKKTLATLLVIALVASLCGVMFVSAEATNLVAGKTYTISEQYRMGGADVGWGYDPNAPVSYPDDGGELTDGVLPESASYGDAAWTALHKNTPAQLERGYGYVRFDLGAVCDLEELKLTSMKQTSAGITCPYIVDVYVSNDGVNYEQAGTLDISAELDGLADDSIHVLAVALDTSAQYVEMRLTSYGWAFMGEVEIMGTAAASEPAGDKTWENTLVEGEDGNYSCEVAYGYTWSINYVDGTIAGEDNTICTSQDAYNACNPNWAITIYAEKQADGTYVALQDAIVCPGSAAGAGITLGENQIAIVAHSAYSNPNGTNWEAKVAAMAVKAGDVLVVADDFSSVYAMIPGESVEDEEPSAPSTGDAGVLVFVVLAVVAVAGVAVASKAKSAL